MNDIVKKEGSRLVSEQQSQAASMIQLAIEKGASIDQLERLMDMQERYEANESRKSYVSAMSEFRAKCPTIAKTRTAHQSKYAGLAETIDQIKSLLSECGLSHSWKTDQSDNGIVSVTCCVTHVAGHQECTTMTAPPDDSGKKNRIQSIASTVSYLERYTLYAILGLASADMDDDGQLAYGANKQIEYIDEAQVANIEALADEVGTKTSAICSFYGVKHLGVFPVKHYDDAIKKLEAKRKGEK